MSESKLAANPSWFDGNVVNMIHEAFQEIAATTLRSNGIIGVLKLHSAQTLTLNNGTKLFFPIAVEFEKILIDEAFSSV